MVFEITEVTDGWVTWCQHVGFTLVLSCKAVLCLGCDGVHKRVTRGHGGCVRAQSGFAVRRHTAAPGASAVVTSVCWSSAARGTPPVPLVGGDPGALWRGRAQRWWRTVTGVSPVEACGDAGRTSRWPERARSGEGRRATLPLTEAGAAGAAGFWSAYAWGSSSSPAARVSV